MTDLGQAYISITPSSKGLASSITDELNSAAGPASKSFGGSFVGKLKGVIGAAALGKVLLDSLKMGAALEQTIGGVETLYKDSADVIKSYAADAWKTAGVSANQYMEQSTSFAAALMNSLGGDSKKAAEAANTAIIDMADNANKMGTSLDSIQNAYQGFAKQNYTMLDNLKLGYGGTKSEMERLLADASKISGVEYDISNLSDVYSAIHVIQTELGITGTTAEEADKTLSGSFMSMKAAAQDFMANLVAGGDISASMANLATSFTTFFFNNLIPALGRVITQLPTALVTFIGDAVPRILDNLTAFFNNFASSKMDSAAQGVISSFVSGLVKCLPQVIMALGRLNIAILKTIISLPGKMFKYAVEAIKAFIKGLKSLKLPKMKITWGTSSKTEGGKKISIPLPHISWNAKGGIFNNPTVLQGVGEAGPEAVIPLERLWTKFDSMAGQIANGVQTAMMLNSNQGKEIHLTVELGGSKVAEKIYRLNKQGEAALVG